MIDLLLRGGTVVDGTGAPPRRADVGVVGDRIVLVSKEIGPDAHTVVDATGRLVTPGFVDIHTHSDLTLLSSPSAPSAVTQGTTTQVVGNCGLGVAPRSPTADVHAIRAGAAYLDLDPDIALTWEGTRGYLDALRDARPAVNVLTFAPHGPLRASVVGYAARPATPREVDEMAGMAREALQDGAVGVSTGLVYAPPCFAEDDELLALGRTVADQDRLFAWHVRDYADSLLESVAQCLRIARGSGCRTQVSHLTAVGRRNWGKVRQALDLVEQARADGLDVGVDMYPYTAGNAPLTQLVPAEVQAGGDDMLKAHLRDPDTVRLVRDAWQGQPVGWDETVVSWLPEGAPPGLAGRSVAEIADAQGRSGDEVALDLLRTYGSAALVVFFGRDEADLRYVLAHPATVVASDGLALDPAGVTGRGTPHPRCYGCFPRYLTRYGQDDLADAVRRCTSAPAGRIRLPDRGTVAEGQVADLLVLDPATLSDTATFDRPHRTSSGVDHVFVSGRPVAERCGQVIGLRGTPRAG